MADERQQIIDLLRGADSGVDHILFSIYTNVNSDITDVQKYLIDKAYNVTINNDYIVPWFVKYLETHDNKNLLPYFIKNKASFEITGFYQLNSSGEEELIENLPKADPIAVFPIRYRFKFDQSNELTMLDDARITWNCFGNLLNHKRDIFEFRNLEGYTPKWFAHFVNSKDYTFQNFYDDYITFYFKSYLLNRGFTGNPPEKDINIKISIKKKSSSETVTDWNNPIWNEADIEFAPFKRKNIRVNFFLESIYSPEMITFNNIDIKFVTYEKIKTNEIEWSIEYIAPSPDDIYQNAIDFILNKIKNNFTNEIKKIKDENFWLFNNEHPEFDWNYGADFLEEINDDLNQFEITNNISNPDEKITKDVITTWTIKTKTSNAFQDNVVFQILIKAFAKHKLEDVAFATYDYQALTTNDTYRDALNAIKNEIRDVVAFNFNEERITVDDFSLTTENEDTIIKQDQTINVTIKATDTSEWLSGKNQFKLNLKAIIISKPFRQFKLINSLQQEIDLQDLNIVIGSNPSDLGIGYKNDFLQIDNDFIFFGKNSNLGGINFNLTFLAPNAYDKYYAFIQFLVSNINDNQPLILTYKIFYQTLEISKNNYYCEVFFKGITKTELNTLKNLEVQINFEKISNWKNLIAKQLEFESNTLVLENHGQLSAPTIIQIFGSSENPYFTLKDEKDQILAESKINYTVGSSDILTIDAKVTEQKIVILRNNEEINIFDSQDFTKETFIFVPPGKSKLVYQNQKGSERIYVSLEEQYISI